MQEKDEHPALKRLLDRHIPNASEAQRQAARESLTRLALILIRIEARLARDWYYRHHRENPVGEVESATSTIPPS